MSLFDMRNVSPMLIGADGPPFDDDEFIYELKWDGERCIAYLDPKGGSELKNKRNEKMLPKVPELSGIHLQVRERCILDGELAVLKDGRPDFYEIQRRSLTGNAFKLDLLSKKHPASFIAFDILLYGERDLTLLPLMERKRYLGDAVARENDRMALSRYVEGKGVSFYRLAEEQGLEGVIAKKKDSVYVQGKRTRDWIKIKNLKDDDFVVCGYIYKENHIISIVLGQYDGGEMVYKGHVTTGVGGENFRKIKEHRKASAPPFPVPAGNKDAIWVDPDLVCTVKFMDYTPVGGLRQPVFKGLRLDKTPAECAAQKQGT